MKVTNYYVVFDVGCIECGADSQLIAVKPHLEDALAVAKKYAIEKGVKDGLERDAPYREPDETTVWCTGYFNNAQHSIEVHKLEEA